MAKWFKRGTGEIPRDTKSRFKAGAYIFKEHQSGDEMYIIQDGLVDILKTMDGEEKQLARLEPGDFFGEMSILEQLPRTGSARAVTDCTLLRIDASTFDNMLTQNPEIAIRMLRKMSRRLRQMVGDPEAPVVSPYKPAAHPTSGSEKLIHISSGTGFFLSATGDTIIGCPDRLTGLSPDIDLSTLDPDRTVSYCHARIVRHNGRFLLYGEIGTANGSSVNGQPVKPGQAFQLKNDDELCFGNVKVRFVTN